MSHQPTTNIPEVRKLKKISSEHFLPETLKPWWDSAKEAEHTGDIYKDYPGSVDHYYLKTLFKEIDLRIFRLVRNRMKPYYAKTVNGTARMSVGHLTLNQFHVYLERLQSSAKCSKIRESFFTLPACNSDNKVYSSLVTCEWKDGKIPHLSHKNDWAFVKYFDRSTNELNRCYAYEFCITYNSNSGRINVHFKYVSEGYDVKDKKWRTR